MTVSERLFGGETSADAEDAPPRPEITDPKAHPAAKGARTELRKAELRVQDVRDRRRDLRTQKRQLERTADEADGDALAGALDRLGDVERELSELREELTKAATARRNAADAHEHALGEAADEIAGELRAYLDHRLTRMAAAAGELRELCEDTMPVMKAVNDRNRTVRAFGEDAGQHPVELPAHIYKPGFLGDRGPLSELRKQLRAAGYDAEA